MTWISIIIAFGIIAVASSQLAKGFQKIKLPLITGFVIVGVLAGPYLLNMLPGNLSKLDFLNDISLGFIALAAGSEMYLKEIRDKIRDISIMTAVQFFITFLVSFVLVMLFSNWLPFYNNGNTNIKIAVAILISTIFIARSPASAIAIINELRAKGPFTKVALGVTILKDSFVIILFAITFEVANVLVNNHEFNISQVFIVLTGLVLSFLFGYGYAKLYELVFSIKKNEWFDFLILLFLGWSMFFISYEFGILTEKFIGIKIHMEALLIGIVASFYITNFSRYRIYVDKLVERFGNHIYVLFFTLIGATLSVNVLLKYWLIAFLLFGIRFFAIMIASATGGIILKEPKKEILLSWTPYITQAGVSLGLITIISAHFLSFGVDFEAILVGVVIINQFIGPPLMKFAIIRIGEAHVKSKSHPVNLHQNIVIFGIGGRAIILAKTLLNQGLSVKIITDQHDVDLSDCTEIPIHKISRIDFETLENLNFGNTDSVIIFRNEEEAYTIGQLIYEKYGTPNVTVVLEKHTDIRRFKELGIIVVAPTSALITLLASFTKSPHATQILLGMQESSEAVDIEVLASDIHGRALRDIKLPLGVLVVSVTRHHDVILPHGFTRLRLHDVITVVGNKAQVEMVRTELQF